MEWSNSWNKKERIPNGLYSFDQRDSIDPHTP
jgi:hypothetical protein